MGSYEIRETKEILENAKPHPHALTRAQVEHRCKNVRDIGHLDWEARELLTHDAAQRLTIEQQAGEIARLENEVCTAKDQIPPDMDGDSLSVALIKLKDHRHDAAQEIGRLKARIVELESSDNY